MSTPSLLHIVEDDDSVREALAIALGDRGFTVRAHASGEGLLAHDLPGPRDVILLDLGLPGMSGAETARHLRAGGSKARLIVMSGQKGCAFATGIAGIRPVASYRKPLETAALFAKLDDLLPAA